MTTTASALPRWDMTVVYPSLESPEFAQGFQAVQDDIAALDALFAQHQIGRHDPAPLDAATVGVFETVLAQMNAVLERLQTLNAYISSFVSTNSRDDLAQAKNSVLQQHGVRLSQLSTRLTAWIGSLDVDALLAQSAPARAHEYMLRKAQVQAAHQMAPAEEALAAELALTGSTAWAKLHNNLTSQLMVPLDTGETLPMSAVRNLAYSADRAERRRGYEAELRAWEGAAVPLAAALNSIKGEVNNLAARRRWESPLDAALFINNI